MMDCPCKTCSIYEFCNPFECKKYIEFVESDDEEEIDEED